MTTRPVSLAPIGLALLLAGVACFQVALALGAPLGAFAWGGAAGHGALSGRFRGASAISALALSALAGLAGVQGGLGQRVFPPPVFKAILWVCAAELALNTLGNLGSPSPPERWVMGPVSALGCGLAVLTAARARPAAGPAPPDV